MAREIPGGERTRSTTDEVVTDALGLLKRDHRLIEELFDEFGRAAPQQLDPLARRICKLLRIHAQIEEELFYPAARRALNESELIDAAEREHAQAKAEIARIESMTSDRAEFKEAIMELAERTREHVAEEEQQLFPQLAGKIDLVAIGMTLAERRDTLLDVLGLHSDDEEGVAQQRALLEEARKARESRRNSNA
ncbi:MAG TPA: hemerythrin domain-containing protein [Steroidobacteraceae bacterium]